MVDPLGTYPPAPTISLLHKIIGFSILKGTAEARRVTIVYLNFPRQKLITHFLPTIEIFNLIHIVYLSVPTDN